MFEIVIGTDRTESVLVSTNFNCVPSVRPPRFPTRPHLLEDLGFTRRFRAEYRAQCSASFLPGFRLLSQSPPAEQQEPQVSRHPTVYSAQSAFKMVDIVPLSSYPSHLSLLPSIQTCNITNLPENYFLKYYLYHAMTWPQLSFVAIVRPDGKNASSQHPKVVGYVLAKLEEDIPASAPQHGHITSISVLRTHRRLGIAEKLMRLSARAMAEVYNAEYVSLHVRVSNKAALALYKDRLGFEVEKTEKGYYADGEDALQMKWTLDQFKKGLPGADGEGSEGVDEGGETGSMEKIEGKEKEKMFKVKVGRGLGVGDLVERNESK